MSALVDFDKPIVVAVHGAAIGGGTTMLTHCDFVYAGESAKFRMPFIDLALRRNLDRAARFRARIGHIRAAELILLGLPFDAEHTAELGLVISGRTRSKSFGHSRQVASKLAAKPSAALPVSKKTHEVGIPRSDQVCDSAREQGVQRTDQVQRSKKKKCGMSGETRA